MLLQNSKILVIDDDEDVLIALRLLLKSKVKEVVTNNNPNNILNLMQQHAFDVVVLDMNFNGLVNTGNEGIFWLNKIKKQSPEVDVILITAYGDIDLAIRSLKEGAADFLVKPWQNEKILDAIRERIEKQKKQGPKKLHLNADTKIIGDSEAMQDVFVKLKKVAPTDANILILGENGTGKDLIAKAIHDNSLRKHKPFVKVDVGALTETLFESELFGYKKGAFTDAREDRKGRFEAANGGTLFLDEIGNISLRQQARLLTVLQNRQVTPLGANQSISIDIRLICATNVSIRDLADEGRFRKDLIYRINTVDMTIPPLRERGTDMTILAHYFIDFYAEKYGKGNFSLSASFIQKLKKHHFSGNVRELQYALERAIIMADQDLLEAEDLTFSAIEQPQVRATENETNLDALEKNTILNVIEKNNGNISKSAKELGITRAALYRRLHKYDL
ncbi:sigma-54-dependent Fis family transcriptional regulator [Subsaximicrobium wynnwilliamsii]|jgi:DNA-binding NtrC family response regulator|uniref:Sigma-54-dependent Fis family transcriptional regulator n=1 Tax=Subsaximicrobium wynnwilliamsii TaxID=291179 RepID=A0A5C6ZEB1_9FLAO|nr:sigma-54 dependent transcriptional regulator [Subsaximicrobium wynnwilliamsii]TXD83177.1 sigma-54-dependent Fis family transcriptional regulator [Subsaximicrobium wynnwilliamsii]TXD88290.1 sigma-54-dependent Fis family transcriptional regulator [Subsaximicrobium wynnwilliamsii]TXE03011.1 sigma-54-dependent Fis family transcriptional regulator [Subsaximicrobium wynnwilliamsii]